MSDGMMEGYRDQCRATEETKFLERLADHIEAPSDATWHALQAQAAATDAVRGGNFSGATNWVHDLGGRVTSLIERDADTWARLLSGLIGAESHSLNWGTGKRLKDVSPFAGKFLITTGERGGFGGETSRLVARAIEGAPRHKVGREHFLVAVDEAAFDVAGAFGTAKQPAPMVREDA